jgi:hypothetical protein
MELNVELSKNLRIKAQYVLNTVLREWNLVFFRVNSFIN